MLLVYTNNKLPQITTKTRKFRNFLTLNWTKAVHFSQAAFRKQSDTTIVAATSRFFILLQPKYNHD